MQHVLPLFAMCYEAEGISFILFLSVKWPIDFRSVLPTTTTEQFWPIIATYKKNSTAKAS